MPLSRQFSSRKSVPETIVLIGASAGGIQALIEIVRVLPPRIETAILVAIHTSPDGPGALPEILNRAGPLRSSYATDGEPIRSNRIYIAPPDHHLLVKPGHLQVSRGPRENGFRPAVDPLFRTAARTYAKRAVGIILSGGLDDGTSGLMEVKRFGGIAIVQDPSEAVFPSMPQSALLNVKVDHVVGLAQIAGLIAEIAANRGVKRKRMNLRRKANLPDIAETGSNRLEAPGFNVPPSAMTCPDCGGALWEVKDGKLLRFRCHLGHGFTADGLNEQQSRSVENALWTAMRALEESALLRRQLAMRSRQSNMTAVAARYDHDARQAENRAAIIRSVLVEDETSQVVKPVRPSPEAREHAGRMNGKRHNVSRNGNHNGNGVKKKTRNRRQRSRAG